VVTFQLTDGLISCTTPRTDKSNWVHGVWALSDITQIIRLLNTASATDISARCVIYVINWVSSSFIFSHSEAPCVRLLPVITFTQSEFQILFALLRDRAGFGTGVERRTPLSPTVVLVLSTNNLRKTTRL